MKAKAVNKNRLLLALCCLGISLGFYILAIRPLIARSTCTRYAEITIGVNTQSGIVDKLYDEETYKWCVRRAGYAY
jgi:hypothetical protein